MRRFFIDPFEPGSSTVILGREESNHLARVLRLGVGDRVELFDGTGSLYMGEIAELGGRVEINILSEEKPLGERIPSLIICQGDLKGRKIDFLVEKCTELGVDYFIRFVSSRSQGRQSSDRRKKKQQRLQTIVKTACKQCGRLDLMELGRESVLADVLKMEFVEPCQKLILWEEAGGLKLGDIHFQDSLQSICLMLGPEGGFSASEVEEAVSCGWQLVSLGERILRAETATISAVAITQHLLGAM